MSRYKFNGRISLWRSCWKVAMGLGAALTLSACVTGGQEATLVSPRVLTGERPTSIRSEALIGRWGVASFRQEKDRRGLRHRRAPNASCPTRLRAGRPAG